MNYCVTIAQLLRLFPRPLFTPTPIPLLSWQVEKFDPIISPDISHRRFQVSNQISPNNFTTHFCTKRLTPKCHQRFHIRDFKFPIKFHQKSSQHTSAGMATPRAFCSLENCAFFFAFVCVKRCFCKSMPPLGWKNSIDTANLYHDTAPICIVRRLLVKYLGSGVVLEPRVQGKTVIAYIFVSVHRIAYHWSCHRDRDSDRKNSDRAIACNNKLCGVSEWGQQRGVFSFGKGSFQKNPCPRDSRESRDSRDIREPPDSWNKGESDHFFSVTKNQPKEEVLGRISLRASGQKLRSAPPNP